MVELKDANDLLAEAGYAAAELPFLSTDTERVSLLIYQPKGDLVPEHDGLGVLDKENLTHRMTRFLYLASEQSVDFAACPEYSCPWDALANSIRAGVFPRNGALWSVCCESITPKQLADWITQLAESDVVVIEPKLTPASGRFLNLLCHMFHARDEKGQDVRVLLMQAKTAPMGGTDYERDALICGSQIIRFGCPKENRLVCLICSDVLGSDFRNTIVHQLQTDTLVIHLQLNKDSASAGFREYRDHCCYTAPRTTEILCLNWAAGTRLQQDGKFRPWVEEPKSIYYRSLNGVDGKDSEIIENHKKGCYLACWDEYKSAVFIFHPEEQIFKVRVAKPLMVGAAPAAKRTAPKVEARYEWQDGSWFESSEDANDHFANFVADNPVAADHLAPYVDKHVDLERLMEFSAGFVLEESAFSWKNLRSFRLARDDTSARLRLCWSEKGVGAEHRGECQRRFKSLVDILERASELPVRLASFRNANVKLSYGPTPRFRQFRNLIEGGARGTVVFMGMEPSGGTLKDVKIKLEKQLYDCGEDRQVLSVLYRSSSGALIDFMESASPAINDDPSSDPTDIFSV